MLLNNGCSPALFLLLHGLFTRLSVIAFLLTPGALLPGITQAASVQDPSVPTVYEDAEDNHSKRWRVYDSNPDGASIRVVDDAISGSKVIQLQGSGKQNGYITGGFNASSGWNNRLQTVLAWEHRFDEDYVVFARLDTLQGVRYLFYDQRSNDRLANTTEKFIHHGLGSASRDGNWHKFSRNLQADLQDAQPDNEIVAVNGFLVRGSGAIDNLSLTQPIAADDKPSASAAARFLTQATFGATSESIAELTSQGYNQWLETQFELQGPPHLQHVLQYSNGSNREARHEVWWYDVVHGKDQLRQRIAYALSQLFVVSDTGYTLSNAQYGVTQYYDLLRNNAFGNYRDLLEDVTLNPVMGIYLSMLQNDKGYISTGTRPDENFAREVLQLFSIGLHQLELDGSVSEPKTPTFSQAVVENFARVFTGWNYKDAGVWNRFLFTGQDLINPLEPFESHHDAGAKTLLSYGNESGSIPAGLSAREDMRRALDNIANHPNVGPFIARRLIQHLVTSNPTPGYISRVAKVFNNNGDGTRGDLKSVIRAILLDNEARNGQTQPGYGKLREPVLKLSHLWRAFNITPGAWSTHGEYSTYSPPLSNLDINTGQAVLRSPSVFNFYSPDHSPAGAIAAHNLVAPEFEIYTDSNILSTTARINSQIQRHYSGTSQSSDLNPAFLDYSEELDLAEDADALLDHLDLILLSGGMSNELRNIVFDHIDAIDSNDATGLHSRVRDAITLIMMAPEYQVQR